MIKHLVANLMIVQIYSAASFLVSMDEPLFKFVLEVLTPPHVYQYISCDRLSYIYCNKNHTGVCLCIAFIG